ncbi:TonB-dependent receptor plug domain-containing protein [Desulfobacter postgatei]|uniref:TonB-dependent receptor plug domain-containing protein n=1 Tax=Desulfobacter postgatei TaxID=2293 RepID=UPI002A36209D|nr:TonB-dependent receptor plug domain-containing protein [Desulfobacter postgatei]MDX9963827.1 TonB-dependent receptor plug domain-containing protein [Desulfobacter postgatei]
MIGKLKIAVIILFSAWISLGASRVWASDTMLMFVGEDLEMLSIASRKEEAAWSAPAIVDVITRQEFESQNAFTLSQALEGTPGFHINQTERSSTYYLRGVPNSALTLFDTVPMGSGVVKSENYMDYETSLAAVKRIEVIRGGSSVLWGPDAFAGVVNIVPLTGKDVDGFQTGLNLSSDNQSGEAYLNYGYNKDSWSGFASVSGRFAEDDGPETNIVRFWNDGGKPTPPEDRYGRKNADDSHFVNFYGSMTYENWLTLSLHLSDNLNAYTVSDWDDEFTWEEQAASTRHMVKLEAVKPIDQDSGLRFTGYLSGTSLDNTIIDNTLDREESSIFAELIYDRSFFLSKSLLTTGISLRSDQYDRVPVWRESFPSYFTDENYAEKTRPPLIDQCDFSNDLFSVFGQYRHKFDLVEIWAGARYDNHKAYEDEISYTTGFAWNIDKFILKGIFGTGYRTPFASQLVQESDPTFEKIINWDFGLEKITTLNLGLSWKHMGTRATATLFRNAIENHFIENRYAGYALPSPNSQDIYGLELEVEHQVFQNVTLCANLTLLNNSGTDEVYYYNDYDYYDYEYYDPKSLELLEHHYIELSHVYETGPNIMGTLKAVWDINRNLSIVPALRYFSGQSIYSPVADETLSCGQAWVMDVNLRIRNYFPFDVDLFAKNLFDNTYKTPGLYSITRNSGFTAGVTLRYSW